VRVDSPRTPEPFGKQQYLIHCALVNVSLLIASIGSGIGAQLGAARLTFAMGRENILPRKFFATCRGQPFPPMPCC
jgi:hypothetical protein